MKMTIKCLAVSLVSLLVAAALAAGCGKSSEAQKTRDDAKATAVKARDTAKDVVKQGSDAVKQGVQQAGKVATNVVHDVKVGAQKAGVVATNVAAKVKNAVTNAVGEVKEKVKDATQ
jgi:hypothetical protein